MSFSLSTRELIFQYRLIRAIARGKSRFATRNKFLYCPREQRDNNFSTKQQYANCFSTTRFTMHVIRNTRFAIVIHTSVLAMFIKSL